ncbi:hypothetical protein CEP51_005238 [Fusarium floridanum]|uniref:Uncharacterized protein n=1 Tax=Fusarium floridanum TaxID=1325733 RepID=A0A428RXW3_9HYPO|nr:hypothetical protein CEP51_005238 [Fusarium floridanum]
MNNDRSSTYNPIAINLHPNSAGPTIRSSSYGKYKSPLTPPSRIRSSSSVIPTLTIIKNTFLTHHSIISQC